MNNLYTVRLTGGPAVIHACLVLVRESRWFSVEPLPFDKWDVTVKNENIQSLLKKIQQDPLEQLAHVSEQEGDSG